MGFGHYGGRNYSGFGSTPHDKVAENWAKQTGKNRKGKRMYYEGARLYSHGDHYCLARLDLDSNRAFINVTPWLNHNGKDSPSTGQHRQHAKSGARRAGFEVIETFDVESFDPELDVIAFIDNAREAMGMEVGDLAPRICKSQQKLWRANWHLGDARASAKLCNKGEARKKARARIAEVLVLIRKGRNAVRARTIKQALPYALAYAFGVLGASGARCIACKWNQSTCLFETDSGQRFRMIKSDRYRQRASGNLDLWHAVQGETRDEQILAILAE